MLKNNVELIGLVEKNTYVIVSMTYSLAAANFFIDMSLGNLFLIPAINSRKGFSEEVINLPWDYTYSADSHSIQKHEFKSEDRNNFILINEKIRAMEIIARNLQIQKNRYKGNNNDFNELILINREQQARNFVLGKEENICYLEEYANALDMTLNEAANDIIIKADLMHVDLARIEGMKLKYFKKICVNSNKLEIDKTMSAFKKECWFNN